MKPDDPAIGHWFMPGDLEIYRCGCCRRRLHGHRHWPIYVFHPPPEAGYHGPHAPGFFCGRCAVAHGWVSSIAHAEDLGYIEVRYDDDAGIPRIRLDRIDGDRGDGR